MKGKNFNYHIYNELAFLYDKFYDKKPYKEEAEFFYKIFQKYAFTKNLNVLDIGCGTGGHLFYLKNLFRNCFGIDPNKNMLKIAKKKLNSHARLYPETIQEFSRQPIFNLIVSFNSTLNYLENVRELEYVFKRIFSMLKNQGVVVIQFHNYIDNDFFFSKVVQSDKDYLIIIADWLRKNVPGKHSIDFFYHYRKGKKWTFYHDVHQEFFFTKLEIISAFKKAGFKKIKILEANKKNSPFNSEEYICSGIRKD